MPTVKVHTTKETPVKFLHAECGVRYWEDAKVNGVEDEKGDLIPLREGDNWCVTIDLETGIIQDWPAGTTADIHYKVCDDGRYWLLDENKGQVKHIDGYVPKMMAPGDEDHGFGDYVIMTVDGAGKVADWKVDLTEFEKS